MKKPSKKGKCSCHLQMKSCYCHSFIGTGVIKKCVNDMCDAIFHNAPKRATRCLDCGYSGALCTINEKTYQKFRFIAFQYEYSVALEAEKKGENPPFYYPKVSVSNQLKIEL